MLSWLHKLTGSFHEPPPPPDEFDKTIPPELIKKIRDIQVKTNHLVNHMMAGEYVSAFKGRGMEFSEVRKYEPGDDVRLIDWNVTARMGHPYIKEFQEERELTVMLLVDVSSSGEFGSVEKFKNEVAAEIASVLSYSAIKNNDKVGLIVFSDTIEHYIPPQKGRAHIWNLIRTILNFVPEGRHTNLNLPLEYLLKVQKRKSVAFLISDFQAEGYLRNLRLVRQKHDLIAIAIADPRESELPDVGWVHLEDSETGETLLVDTADRTLTEQLARLKIKERQERKKQFHANGVDVIDIQTDRSLTQPLIQFFKMREKRL
ncbi:MAG: DUF58 domain-containing protein [Nitrospinae bacterium]|nr:DUF58 domain-containing protein [Nitrospinota bacterium]